MLAALVLAGGASTRMGTDKATLVVEGQRLIDRAIDAMAPNADGPIVVAGPDPGALAANVEVVEDPDGPRQGPLAGLVSGWRRLNDGRDTSGAAIDGVIVLSCDLPSVDRGVVQQLVEASIGGADVMAHDGERPQPLLAVYSRSTIERLVAAFDDGERSIRRALDLNEVVIISIDKARASDADSPSDLAGRAVDWPANVESPVTDPRDD